MLFNSKCQLQAPVCLLRHVLCWPPNKQSIQSLLELEVLPNSHIRSGRRTYHWHGRLAALQLRRPVIVPFKISYTGRLVYSSSSSACLWRVGRVLLVRGFAGCDFTCQLSTPSFEEQIAAVPFHPFVNCFDRSLLKSMCAIPQKCYFRCSLQLLHSGTAGGYTFVKHMPLQRSRILEFFWAMVSKAFYVGSFNAVVNGDTVL